MTGYKRPAYTRVNDIDYPTILGRVNRAMYVFQMNWAKTTTRRATKVAQLRNLRNACAEFVAWHDEAYPQKEDECPT